ncbi:MAG: hypothetical protein H7836_04325 [Magnetococcus sp. YQC-3]
MNLQNLSIDQILMLVMGVNTSLTMIQKVLFFLKDKTDSKADDKLYELLSKGLGGLSLIVEFLSANTIKNQIKEVEETGRPKW